MTETIKDSTTPEASTVKPVRPMKTNRIDRKPLTRDSLLARSMKNSSVASAVSPEKAAGSKMVVGGAANLQSRQHEKKHEPDMLPVAIRDINALAKHRKQVPYNELKLFEKISVVHSVMVKMSADARFGEDSTAVSVMREHLFLMFELERLTHVR